jgi:hypothetical protein
MCSFYMTKFPGRVNYYSRKYPMTIAEDARDELVEYCKPFVRYVDNAYFDGLNVRLYTNIEHVYDFWRDNWWSYSHNVVPHGQVYAIDDGGKINLRDYYDGPLQNPDVNVGGLYSSETKTAIILNQDYYGHTKPSALGIAADIFEDQYDILSVHGASGSIDGKGYLLIAPTNTGKTTHSYGPAIHHPGGEFHQDDWIFVEFEGGKAIGKASEKQFYMRTNSIENFPWLEPIFRMHKLENVKPDDPKEKFLPPDPRVMIDPREILSPQKVVNEIRINKCFLLERNPKENVVAKSLSSDEAVEILLRAPEQFYNNYLTIYTERKIKKRAQLFRKLFEIAEPYQINIVAKVEVIRDIIIRITKS